MPKQCRMIERCLDENGLIVFYISFGSCWTYFKNLGVKNATEISNYIMCNGRTDAFDWKYLQSHTLSRNGIFIEFTQILNFKMIYDFTFVSKPTV